MADMDLMRNVNNSLGHLAGDEVLKVVGGVLRRSLRGDDMAGRFGGEEFIILLRNTDAKKGLLVAERLRAAVEATSINLTDSPEPLRVTMSLGVASFPEPCSDPSRLLRDADTALYRSKLEGRNRVTLALPVAGSQRGSEGDQGSSAFHEEAADTQLEGGQTAVPEPIGRGRPRADQAAGR